MVLQASSGPKAQHGGGVKVLPKGPAPAPARGGKGWGKGKGTPSNTASAGQIAQLREMGFTDEVAKRALAESVWDVNKALDMLFTRGAEAFMSDTPVASAGGSGSRSGKGQAVDKSGHDTSGHDRQGLREDRGEVSTTASTASSPRSTSRIDMHSPVPVLENQVSSLTVGARTEAVTAAQGGAANGCSSQVASTLQASAVESVAICEATGVPGAEAIAVVLEQEPAAPLPPIDEVVDVQSTIDAASTANAVSTEDCASEVARDAAPPRKRVERVCASWIGEDTVLTVSPNEFVLVWADSTTEHEWIYAENLLDTTRAGWLPTFVFEVLPQHQKWMTATSSLEAVNETQLEVRQGNVFKVSLHTRTEEGWAYAELACNAEDHSLDRAGTAPTGWVPDFCFEWTEE